MAHYIGNLQHGRTQPLGNYSRPAVFLKAEHCKSHHMAGAADDGRSARDEHGVHLRGIAARKHGGRHRYPYRRAGRRQSEQNTHYRRHYYTHKHGLQVGCKRDARSEPGYEPGKRPRDIRAGKRGKKRRERHKQNIQLGFSRNERRNLYRRKRGHVRAYRVAGRACRHFRADCGDNGVCAVACAGDEYIRPRSHKAGDYCGEYDQSGSFQLTAHARAYARAHHDGGYIAQKREKVAEGVVAYQASQRFYDCAGNQGDEKSLRHTRKGVYEPPFGQSFQRGLSLILPKCRRPLFYVGFYFCGSFLFYASALLRHAAVRFLVRFGRSGNLRGIFRIVRLALFLSALQS